MSKPPIGRVEGRAHVFPLRVYFEDTDAGGVVYYANYLKFVERARTEMLRALGERHAELVAAGQSIVVRHVEADYLRPAALDDDLEVFSSVVEVKGASAVMRQIVRRGADELARVTVKLVCMELSSGRAVRLPPSARAVLNDFVEG